MATTTATTTAPSTTPPPAAPADERLRAKILRTIARRTFCTLATVSPAGNPHVAGVVYDAVDGRLWIHTLEGSRKARNVAANPSVAVSIPYRRLPMGPPFTIHFQARARLVAMDDPEVVALLETGELGHISGHGALDMPDGVFVVIEPVRTIHSYGPGARIIDLARDPLNHGAASFPISEVAS